MELERILVTGVAAFAGAWVASLFALNRYRQEKAFDRTLDWYIEIVDVLRRACIAAGVLARTLRRPDAAYAEQLVSFAKVSEELNRMVAGAQIFADMSVLKDMVERDILGALTGLRAKIDDDRGAAADLMAAHAEELVSFQADVAWAARRHRESRWMHVVRLLRGGRKEILQFVQEARLATMPRS